MRLILASTSPARLTVLRQAGIEPVVIAPDVDEEAEVALKEQSIGRELNAAELVLYLARLKAQNVAKKLRSGDIEALAALNAGRELQGSQSQGGALQSGQLQGLVLGGDSAFLLGGKPLGKPHYKDVALRRAKEHRGQTGVLHSGHWLIDLAVNDDSQSEAGQRLGSLGEVDTAEVTLAADVSDAELAAYVATGEPLELAGGFAIDGLAGAYISSIKGAPSCVIGLSLPALRRLVAGLGYQYHALWNNPV